MLNYVFSSGAERFFVGDAGLHGFDPLYLFSNNNTKAAPVINFFRCISSENDGK